MLNEDGKPVDPHTVCGDPDEAGNIIKNPEMPKPSKNPGLGYLEGLENVPDELFEPGVLD